MKMKLWAKPAEAPPAPDKILATLPEPFRSILLSMYAGEPQPGADDRSHSLDGISSISPEQGMWIYEFCRRTKPAKTVEIGLAYGFSTLYILAALYENGEGSHTSIDPFQSAYHEIGMHQPARVNMERVFRHIKERSYPAMTDLARKSEMFDFIFIDGNHRFDDALVDFTLSSEVCANGGHIVFDDMWMDAIQRAVAFVRLNRKDFSEVQTPIRNIAVFRRIAADKRNWDHYLEF